MVTRIVYGDVVESVRLTVPATAETVSGLYDPCCGYAILNLLVETPLCIGHWLQDYSLSYRMRVLNPGKKRGK